MQLLTINEAAELAGKSIQTIRRIIKRKKVQIKRKKTPQGFNYLIVKDSLLELLNQGIQAPAQIDADTQVDNREHRPINSYDDETFRNQLDGLTTTIQKLVDQNQKDKENFFGLIRTFQDRIGTLEGHIKMLEAPSPWWKLW